jgi:hypothetical protein
MEDADKESSRRQIVRKHPSRVDIPQDQFQITYTNKPFGEWNQVFPNAACVVALVDRLVHRSEILTLAGNSYRLKEAQERAAQRASQRGPGKKAR